MPVDGDMEKVPLRERSNQEKLLGTGELGYMGALHTGRQEGQRRGRAAGRPVAAAVFSGCCCHGDVSAAKGAARTGGCPARRRGRCYAPSPTAPDVDLPGGPGRREHNKPLQS